ncbi:MAG: glycosyltransferase [Synechococcaceae cyanobacterium SM2_3_1]|nr:glycosyltransferase [Synechococcaceae cyanobacterium SM2_3_1]
MTIKNEANCIGRCLDQIVDLFSEIIILDTGSTDNSKQILQNRYGIQPLDVQLSEQKCYLLAEARNYGFSLLKTPWILSLDADEVITREELLTFLQSSPEKMVSGYFCRWDNYEQEGNNFEDYKLFFFRKGMQKRGFIHDNVQLDIREKGLKAAWFDPVIVKHYPEVNKKPISDPPIFRDYYVQSKSSPPGIAATGFLDTPTINREISRRLCTTFRSSVKLIAISFRLSA